MKTHTSGFKEQIKLIGKELDSKITFGETVLGKKDLNAVTPSYKGAILKSVMKRLDIDSNVEIPIGTILKYEFGLKVNGEYEYINYGNYVVYSIEKQEDTNSYKIVCYDKLLYSMLEYTELPLKFPMTIREYINSLCLAIGITFKNKNNEFANYDKLIEVDLYANIGYTFRDIFDDLAQVTASTICLNENDELEIRYINETNDTIDEEYLKDVNVNFGEKFGPINTIVLSRSAGSDNIYYPENLPDEPYELKISDNQIMNGNNRVDFLPNIYNKLNGLEFYTNDFISTGICYYDLCDRYSVRVGENIYSCVMFNDEVLVTQGLEENIYTELPEQTETDYTKADKTDRKINQVSLIVDKQNQMIQSIADKVVDVSKITSGIGSVMLESAYEGVLHKLSLKGNVSLLYPNNNLFPSPTLYPKSVKLQVDETIYELDINYLNYINSKICDEFVYEDGNCYIVRRIGINENGEMYELANELIEQRRNILINVLENSTITLLGFDDSILTVEYLLKNKYTDTFATQAYVNSEIRQTADEINFEVSKKVNEDEVVNKINVSTEQITLKGNRLVVEADNFRLDEEGNMTCNDGNLKNVNIKYGKISLLANDKNNYGPAIEIIAEQENVNNDRYLLIEDLYVKTVLSPQSLYLRNKSLDYPAVSLRTGYQGNSGILTLMGPQSSIILTSSTNDSSYSADISIRGDGGIINCTRLNQSSIKEKKKNFERLTNAKDILNNVDIYKYNFKDEDDTVKKSIGFVIGDDFNYSSEITSVDNNGVNIYSMLSVVWQVVKEQQEEILNLKEEVNKLKEMIK